jgi:hypothetical protein
VGQFAGLKLLTAEHEEKNREEHKEEPELNHLLDLFGRAPWL